MEHDEQLTAALEPDSSSDGGVKIGAFNGNNMGTSWESIYLSVCLSIYIILYMLHGNMQVTSWEHHDNTMRKTHGNSLGK